MPRVIDKMSGIDVTSCCERLMRSERGRAALEQLRPFISDYFLGLDGGNQEAVECLLVAASNSPMSVREEIDRLLEK